MQFRADSESLRVSEFTSKSRGHNRDRLGLGKVPFPPHVKLTARGGAKIITSTCSRTTFCTIGIVRHGLAHESGAAGRARSLIHDSRRMLPSIAWNGLGHQLLRKGVHLTCIRPQHPAGMSQCSPADANNSKVG